MNAKVEPFSALARGPEPACALDSALREGILEIPGEMSLHHGGRLAGVRIAWRVAGAAGAPLVCALGGISAHRRVCGTEDPREGWWSQVVGTGRALDTARFRVLSFDFLGGSGESTGPLPQRHFPSISTYDQGEVLLRLLDHLGIRALRAIVGGSYGGMVGLAFAERHPDRLGHLITIGAADRAHPMATAWRSIQRQIVRLGITTGTARQATELARALAMTTYRSGEEFAARFAAAPEREGGEFVFPVERYLCARGRDYAARYRGESLLCLSESIDLHRVDAARIFVPTTAVAVREDQLVPLNDVRAMVARLPAGRLEELSSLYGHDAFLKEAEALRRIFERALGGAA